MIISRSCTWRQHPLVLVLNELLEASTEVSDLRPLLPAGVGGPQLLDPVRVPQGVEGVLTRGHTRPNHSNLQR